MHLTLIPNQILHFVVIYFCLFATALVWHNKRIRSVLWIMGVAFLGAIFNLLEELEITREWHLVTPIFLLAHGPSFYLFTKGTVLGEKFKQHQLFHFIPCLIALPFTEWTQTIIAIASLSQFVYTGVLIHGALRHKKAAISTQSDSQYFDIKWIITVFVLVLVMGGINIIRLNTQPYIGHELNVIGQFATTAFGLGIYSYLIVKLLQQEGWVEDVSIVEAQLATEDESNDLETESLIFQEIKQQLVTQELYKTPRLSLREVADITGISEREVSRAVNLVSGSNFNDLVNGLRIDAIKAQLSQSQHRTILEVALENGFNSKSSFNQTFKQITGMTPGQYLN